MTRRTLLPALLLTTLALPSLAQDAPVREPRAAVQPEPADAGTPAGAQTIREALAAFTTDTPFTEGALRVEPDPAGHRITFDAAPLLAKLPEQFSSAAIAPFSIVVSRREDANWNVFYDDPLDISFKGEVAGEMQSFDYRIDRQAFKGVYSPDLATFLSGEGYSDAVVSDQSDAVSKAHSTIERSDYTMEGTAAPDGAANLTFRQTLEGYEQTTAIDISDETVDLSAFSFDFDAGQMLITGAADAARTRDMLDIYAFVLGNAEDFGRPGGPDGPTPELAAQLKTRAGAALPLWDRIDSEFAVEDVSVSGLLGSATIGRASQTVEMSGVSTEAFLRVGMSMSDFSVESSMMPDWASALVPEIVELGFSVENVDLASPTAIFLEEADFTSRELLSPEARERVLEAMKTDRIRTRIEPSRLKAGAFDMTMSGDVRFVDARPAVTFDISAKGVDETIETLQAAAAEEPELNQIVGMMQIAKGFAKPLENGRLQWEVELASDGSVTMNGAMLKGPDAPAAEDGLDSGSEEDADPERVPSGRASDDPAPAKKR